MRPKQLEKFKVFQQANPLFSLKFAEGYYESMPAISPPQIERGFLENSIDGARKVFACAQPRLVLCGTKELADAFRAAFPDLHDKIRHFSFFEGDCFIVIDSIPLVPLRARSGEVTQ
jgi:hypothetical protein